MVKNNFTIDKIPSLSGPRGTIMSAYFFVFVEKINPHRIEI